MTVAEFLKESGAKLQKAGISSARLDTLLLLEDATGRDRSWLLANQDYVLSKQQIPTLKSMVERRSSHEPLAYIRGKSEFYGRKFLVTADTLQPRPETETMIELLKQFVEDGRWKMEDGSRIIDVGTGSGCLAITAKLELPEATVFATDISKPCLKVARENAKKHQAEVQFFEGNLLDPLPPSIFHLPSSKFAILANLPYVPDSHTINQAATYEPKVAIFGGEDGLDYYRRMFKQIKDADLTIQHILTESLPPHHQALEEIASGCDFKLVQTQDFIQHFTAVN